MKKTGYIVRLVIFALLVVVGVFLMKEGLNELRRCRDIRSHEAMNLIVDFSVQGEYRGIFKQRFIREHGKQLRLMVEPPFDSSEEIAVSLGGLRGYFEIRDQDGSVVRREEVVPESFVELHKGSIIREKDIDFPKSSNETYKLGFECCGYEAMDAYTPYLFYDFAKLGFDSYDFVFSVVEPAAGMKGRSQRLVSKNAYCTTVWGFLQAVSVVVLTVGSLFLVGAVFVGKNVIKALRRMRSQF
jgi:hypothetical protein